MMCSKGCGRPAKVRGMCKSHYSSDRKHRELLGLWMHRTASIGVTRRLRALNALGYSQDDLAARLGVHYSWVCKLMSTERAQVNKVNPDTVTRVTDLYNQLSMTPGPSERARRAARIKGWAPPLAWDDDTIDDPNAQPDGQLHRSDRKTVPFTEEYLELRSLGYNDLQIVRKWSIKPESLLRQLNRYDIPPSPALVTLAASRKYQRSKAAS